MKNNLKNMNYLFTFTAFLILIFSTGCALSDGGAPGYRIQAISKTL
jgi:hypothetical protein